MPAANAALPVEVHAEEHQQHQRQNPLEMSADLQFRY
jgi:hypothetical protein